MARKQGLLVLAYMLFVEEPLIWQYAVSLGKDKAMMLMNHERAGMVLDQYTSGMEHVPLVPVRLEEFAGSLTPLEREILFNTKMASVAVDCLISRSRATGAPLPPQGQRWQALTDEEEAKLQIIPEVSSATNQHKAAWLSLTSLFNDTIAPYSKECKRLVPKLKKQITPAISQQFDIKLKAFEANNKLLIKVRRKALLQMRKTQKALKTARVQATGEERQQAQKELGNTSSLVDEALAAYRAEASTKDWLRSKSSQITRLSLTPAQAKTMGIPESIRDVLAKLPPASGTQEEPVDDEEDEEEIEMVDKPLEGQGIPQNQAPEFQTKFTPLNNSTRTGPKSAIELDDEEPTNVDDQDEADVLGLDVDIARWMYGRYLYKPVHQALQVSTAKQGKEFICRACPDFRSRLEKLVSRLTKKGVDASNPEFTFKTEISYNRHMRVQHSDWMNLELEMQQDDSEEYICPGCQEKFQTLGACQKHCRTKCNKKQQFIALYNDYLSTRPADNPAVLQGRMDRRREQKWEGKAVPITQAGLDIVMKLRDDLEAYPDFFEEWLGRIPKAHTLGMTLAELQDRYLEIILLALSMVPKDRDEQEIYYTQGLKSTAISKLLSDSYDALKRHREDNPSDYDESSDDNDIDDV